MTDPFAAVCQGCTATVTFVGVSPVQTCPALAEMQFLLGGQGIPQPAYDRIFQRLREASR